MNKKPNVTVNDEDMDNAPLDSWANLLKQNRAARNGMALDYIPPQIIEGYVFIQLEKEEVDHESHKWRRSLIVYAIGDCPRNNIMTIFINQN